MRTVLTAVEHWKPVAQEHGWDLVISTDDPERGAKLTAFVLDLLDQTNLVYGSISNYVWGLRWHMKLQHQADPAMGVLGWSDFMASVKVLSWVPHEPRRALPVHLLKKMAEIADVTNFRHVNFILFVIILYFTFSRAECPCPKHFTGDDGWDDNKHWMVRDFKLARVANSLLVALKVRFKAIKQDPRIERPSARGDGSERGVASEGGADWSWIGDVPDSILSPFKWFKLHASFFDGKREPTDSFFKSEDMVRPYTYTAATRDLMWFLQQVSPDDTAYGLHGIRVEGYNNSKKANGEDLTVAHGLWSDKQSAGRYSRWLLWQVCSISAGMEGVPSKYTHDNTQPPEVREIVRVPNLARATSKAPAVVPTPGPRSPPGTLPTVVEEDDDDEPLPKRSPGPRRIAPSLSPPPGWSMRKIRGEKQPQFVPPSQIPVDPVASVARAWRVHNEFNRLDTDGGSIVVEDVRARTRGAPSSS